MMRTNKGFKGVAMFAAAAMFWSQAIPAGFAEGEQPVLNKMTNTVQNEITLEQAEENLKRPPVLPPDAPPMDKDVETGKDTEAQHERMTILNGTEDGRSAEAGTKNLSNTAESNTSMEAYGRIHGLLNLNEGLARLAQESKEHGLESGAILKRLEAAGAEPQTIAEYQARLDGLKTLAASNLLSLRENLSGILKEGDLNGDGNFNADDVAMFKLKLFVRNHPETPEGIVDPNAVKLAEDVNHFFDQMTAVSHEHLVHVEGFKEFEGELREAIKNFKRPDASVPPIVMPEPAAPEAVFHMAADGGIVKVGGIIRRADPNGRYIIEIGEDSSNPILTQPIALSNAGQFEMKMLLDAPGLHHLWIMDGDKNILSETDFKMPPRPMPDPVLIPEPKPIPLPEPKPEPAPGTPEFPQVMVIAGQEVLVNFPELIKIVLAAAIGDKAFFRAVSDPEALHFLPGVTDVLSDDDLKSFECSTDSNAGACHFPARVWVEVLTKLANIYQSKGIQLVQLPEMMTAVWPGRPLKPVLNVREFIRVLQEGAQGVEPKPLPQPRPVPAEEPVLHDGRGRIHAKGILKRGGEISFLMRRHARFMQPDGAELIIDLAEEETAKRVEQFYDEPVDVEVHPEMTLEGIQLYALDSIAGEGMAGVEENHAAADDRSSDQKIDDGGMVMNDEPSMEKVSDDTGDMLATDSSDGEDAATEEMQDQAAETQEPVMDLNFMDPIMLELLNSEAGMGGLMGSATPEMVEEMIRRIDDGNVTEESLLSDGIMSMMGSGMEIPEFEEVFPVTDTNQESVFHPYGEDGIVLTEKDSAAVTSEEKPVEMTDSDPAREITVETAAIPEIKEAEELPVDAGQPSVSEPPYTAEQKYAIFSAAQEFAGLHDMQAQLMSIESAGEENVFKVEINFYHADGSFIAYSGRVVVAVNDQVMGPRPYPFVSVQFDPALKTILQSTDAEAPETEKIEETNRLADRTGAEEVGTDETKPEVASGDAAVEEEKSVEIAADAPEVQTLQPVAVEVPAGTVPETGIQKSVEGTGVGIDQAMQMTSAARNFKERLRELYSRLVRLRLQQEGFEKVTHVSLQPAEGTEALEVAPEQQDSQTPRGTSELQPAMISAAVTAPLAYMASFEGMRTFNGEVQRGSFGADVTISGSESNVAFSNIRFIAPWDADRVRREAAMNREAAEDRRQQVEENRKEKEKAREEEKKKEEEEKEKIERTDLLPLVMPPVAAGSETIAIGEPVPETMEGQEEKALDKTIPEEALTKADNSANLGAAPLHSPVFAGRQVTNAAVIKAQSKEEDDPAKVEQEARIRRIQNLQYSNVQKWLRDNRKVQNGDKAHQDTDEVKV